MGGEGFQGITSGGGGLDCRALPDNGTLYQFKLPANDYPNRGGLADLDGRCLAGLDHPGGYSRRFDIWIK